MTTLSSAALSCESLREQAARALRASIATGELEEGRLYSVGEFAKRFGVSATPVREAVGDLAADGLVTVIRNRGFFVPALAERDLGEIFELRVLLEVPAVLSLCGSLSAQDAAACRKYVEEGFEFARKGELAAFLETDRAFHLGLVGASGNQRLVDIVGKLRDETRLYGLPGVAAAGRLGAAASEHAAILAAVEDGDEPRAREELVRHLRHIRGLWAGRESSADAAIS